MTPKTALLELATRRSNYICRSCSRTLGIQHQQQRQPNQSFVRFYAGNPRRHGAPPVIPKSASDNPLKEPEDKGYTVNYFEKDETGEVRRVSVGEDEDDVEIEDIRALEASAMAKLEKLDATLESLSQKSQFLETLLARHGPDGAVEAFRKAMESYGDDDELNTSGIPLIAEDAKSLYIRKAELDRLNNLIALVNTWVKRCAVARKAGKLTRLHISKTWSYFVHLKQALVKGKIITVPKKAWDTLWELFSLEGPANPARMAQVRDLYNIMTRANAPLSDEQHLLAIEAAFVQGYTSFASEHWKRFAPTLGEKESCAIAFWELGVRLWSQQGDIPRAERASRAALDRATPSTPADSRVLLHLIKAYANQADTAEKGFLLYRRMRELANQLGKPLEIEDYDDIISIFLTTGHTDYAMFAFTDMMYAGTINLYGKTKLPNSVKNRFFFGKWLKRLIGAGDLDGAYKVLVYMQKNGVMAPAVQVNGLIGAWLRSRTADNRKKAVGLAWSMIDTRKAFVELRRRERAAEWPIRLYDGRPNNSDHQGEDLDYTMVPRATAETFILMAENYRERGLFGQLEELFVAYKESEIAGDALMMNELIAAAVAQGRGDKAQEIYHMMVHEHDILPNADTHAILFKSLPINNLKGRQLEQVAPAVAVESRAQARALFADMMTSTWVYQEEGWRERHGGMLSEAQVKLVLHSFRKCGDSVGVIVALECLRDVLRFRITRNVLLEMIAEVEDIDRPSPRTHKVVVRTTMKLQSLVEKMQRERRAAAEKKAGQRGVGAGGEGGAPADADVDADKVRDPQFLYSILLEHYLDKAKKQHHDIWFFKREMKKAWKEMGAATVVRPDMGDEDEEP
ncbi:hypothetical protein VMCG_06220 [Cytospora schulzeri]|uniref:Pentacotripeptide-repeat region of PRORP domain-containing protein n=1 Tax=Cytospora schulzeri TaxID=448051 RepID=A0A423W983_9PEZI|nr:hypothetical protein VMCG_06220 [Valsa malicola]